MKEEKDKCVSLAPDTIHFEFTLNFGGVSFEIRSHFMLERQSEENLQVFPKKMIEFHTFFDVFHVISVSLREENETRIRSEHFRQKLEFSRFGAGASETLIVYPQ